MGLDDRQSRADVIAYLLLRPTDEEAPSGWNIAIGFERFWLSRHRTLDDDWNSINAMSPDPNALMAVSASDALLNNQALQRKSMRDEIATLAAQATATAARFNTLITGHLHTRKPGANRRRHLPDGMMCIGRD